MYLELRRHLGDVFRKLAEQKKSRIEEGHLLLDHVHMLISIPPKHAVSQDQEAGRGGQTSGADEFVALIATFRWPTRSGAASAVPSAALSGSQPKAPGFAGGYLLSEASPLRGLSDQFIPPL